MIALLIAAQVALLPAPGMAPLAPNAPSQRTPNLYQPKPGCDVIARLVAEQEREEARKLGRLPNAGKEYAVMRQVEGCMVPAPMGYHPPALTGAADAPAMRESTR